jgi:CBS domain-containing protein
MSVGEICNRDVITIEKSAPVARAARLMRQYHVGSVIVVADGSQPPRPVGIVTDRDLAIEILAQEVPAETVTVGDVMAAELLTAREEDGVWETIMRMRAVGVRRLPVVTRNGDLAGILTMDDLLQFIVGELSDLVKLVRREQKREEAIRHAPL